jgi:hypothetical protein
MVLGEGKQVEVKRGKRGTESREEVEGRGGEKR